MTKSRNRDSSRQLFRRLEISPLQSQYIFSLLLFVVNNKDLYTTNQEIHNITKRTNINLHPTVCNLIYCVPKGSLLLWYKVIQPPTTKYKKSHKCDKNI